MKYLQYIGGGGGGEKEKQPRVIFQREDMAEITLESKPESDPAETTLK